MFERWIPLAVVMTAGSGVFAYAMLPFTGMTNRPGLAVMLPWMTLSCGIGCAFLLWKTLRMMAAREPRPLLELTRYDFSTIIVGTFLVGLNLAMFGMVKPQLGQIVAFSADPFLADLDKLLFGADVWTYLRWFDHPGMAELYHQAWIVWVAAVLLCLLAQTPSVEKNRLIISFFALWSIFGPLVHLAFPAAGPVFYDQLGLGDRFIALAQSKQSQEVADYLWTGYEAKTFNAAGGISAMPSLHLATMAWTVIALRKTRWLWPSILLTLYILLGSIAIGWHYAVDGIAGGIGALLCYRLTFPRLNASTRLQPA